jgi:hypothetical protein
MRLGFEKLERRELFSLVGLDIEGPVMAYADDEVTYAVKVTSRQLDARSFRASLSLPLNLIAVVYTWPRDYNFSWTLPRHLPVPRALGFGLGSVRWDVTSILGR